MTPWVPVALLSLALTALVLWRRRWELLGLLAVLSPYAVLLAHTSSSQVHSKTLMAPMMPIPLLLGVAWVALAQRGSDGRLLPGPLRRLLPGGAAGADAAESRRPGAAVRAAAGSLPGLLAGVLVLGLVPGWLSPTAQWRLRSASDPDFYNVQARAAARARGLPSATGTSRREACEALLAADLKRGIPAHSRLYPRQGFEQRWEVLRGPAGARGPRDLPPAPPPPPPPEKGVPGRR